MKKTEIKKNIFKIAADVFRDTQVLFVYLFIHNYQRTYLEQIAVQSDTKDWKMVSIEKISRKFIQLDEYLGILDKIAEVPENAFLKDKILIGSAKYYLQISIECCLDVANHIIAAERYRAPRDYADSFAVLEEKGIF